MTQPTNTDLADALREIANTLPLGSALVVRLAADRLDPPVRMAEACEDPDDGWIEWDTSATGAHLGPKLDHDTFIAVRFASGGENRGSVGYWRDFGPNNWDNSSHVRISAYRVLP